jgi:hypothetical protein
VRASFLVLTKVVLARQSTIYDQGAELWTTVCAAIGTVLLHSLFANSICIHFTTRILQPLHFVHYAARGKLKARLP